VSNEIFKTVLFLPSQAAAETEAIITKWLVNEGDTFKKGQILAEIESAKSTFEFEAPCDGKVAALLFKEGNSAPFESAVIEIETSDQSLKNAIPSAGAKNTELPKIDMVVPHAHAHSATSSQKKVSLLGIGSYLPQRVVFNGELLVEHTDITADYIFGVTGINERR
jgi:pyruvate/2-oxoglutarate dehydrogenase complex dihydrolipoamide acyltransferase (E2) component